VPATTGDGDNTAEDRRRAINLGDDGVERHEVTEEQRNEMYGQLQAATKCLNWGEMYRLCRDLPPLLLADREFIYAAVQLTFQGNLLHAASDELKNDREVVLAAVNNEGFALEHASDELKDDREVVFAALSNHGWALDYASDELKNDREVVLAAVDNDGRALEDASDELKNDREVVIAAVNNKGWVLQYASDELRNDPFVASEAIQCSNIGFQFSLVEGELKGQIKLIVKKLEVDCGFVTGLAPLPSANDVENYADERGKKLWENIWLMFTQAPPKAGVEKPLSAELRNIILEFAGVREEANLSDCLKHCAPVLEAFASKGVAWNVVDVDNRFIRFPSSGAHP